MEFEFVILRLVHLLAGTFWVGTAVFTAAYLLPALGEAGPAAGAVMAGLQKRRMMVVLPIAAALTLLAGIRLLWLVSGGFNAAYLRTPTGLAFTLGGAAALVAFLLGIFISRPAMARAGVLSQRVAGADGADRDGLMAEIQRLRQRAAVVTLWVAVLLVLATAGMAVARYL